MRRDVLITATGNLCIINLIIISIPSSENLMHKVNRRLLRRQKAPTDTVQSNHDLTSRIHDCAPSLPYQLSPDAAHNGFL